MKSVLTLAGVLLLVLLTGCSVQETSLPGGGKQVTTTLSNGQTHVVIYSSKGTVLRDELYPKEEQAEVLVPPPEPEGPTVRVIGGYQDAGWRHRHRGVGEDPYYARRPYDQYGGGHERRIYQGQPYVVHLPPPPGGDWVPYDRGPLDSGWVRSRCIANC